MAAPIKPWQRPPEIKSETFIQSQDISPENPAIKPQPLNQLHEQNQEKNDITTHVNPSNQLKYTDNPNQFQPRPALNGFTTSNNTIYDNPHQRFRSSTFNSNNFGFQNNFLARNYSPYMNGYGISGFNTPPQMYNGLVPGFYDDFSPNWIDRTADSLGKFIQILEMNSYFVDQLIDLTSSISNHIGIILSSISKIPVPRPNIPAINNPFSSFFNYSYFNKPNNSQKTNLSLKSQRDLPFSTCNTLSEVVQSDSDSSSVCSDDSTNSLFGDSKTIYEMIQNISNKIYMKVDSVIFGYNQSLTEGRKRFKTLLLAFVFYILIGSLLHLLSHRSRRKKLRNPKFQ